MMSWRNLSASWPVSREMSDWSLHPSLTGRELRAGELAVRQHDEVLVDTGCYCDAGTVWCRVTRIAPGTASVFPIKAEMPNGVEGQFKPSEVEGHRRPPELEEAERFQREMGSVPNEGNFMMSVFGGAG